MTSLLFAVLMTAAPPTTFRYVMEVADVPVAEMRVTVDGDRYDYAATHFFEENSAQRVSTFSLKALPAVPEVLALSTLGEPGCRAVFGEKRQQLEQVCITAIRSAVAKGTIDGTEFLARYVNGRLEEITVATAHWRAIGADVPAPPPSENPFVKGVPAPAAAAAFSPALASAKWLAVAPTPSGNANARARCLVLAREAVKQKPAQRRVVVGLVLENGRAFPHAWVAEGDTQLDPSLIEAVPGRRYVEFPRADSGRLYLALFAGALKLVPK